PINLRALLYVPTHKVSQVEFATGFEESCVSLYARKVLIKANAKELLPRYLRFLVNSNGLIENHYKHLGWRGRFRRHTIEFVKRDAPKRCRYFQNPSGPN